MNNVIEKYTDFIKEQFVFFGKQVLDKYYVASIFDTLVNEYISVRYYNRYPSKGNVTTTINYYVKNKIKELKETNENKIKNIEFMEDIFNYLIFLDTDIENNEVNRVEKLLCGLRKQKYNIEEPLEFSKDYKMYNKIKKDYIKAFESNDFYLEYKLTKKKNLFDISINHNVKMPDLYSSKVINKVYNSGIIAEDKLFIEYNLINIKILEEIINYDYSTNYLIDFNVSLFDKKEKINRLLKIIDNDITKEKLCFKISYTDFLNNKDDIFKLINKGYNFALIKDENYKEDSYINLFKYLLVKEV